MIRIVGLAALLVAWRSSATSEEVREANPPRQPQSESQAEPPSEPPSETGSASGSGAKPRTGEKAATEAEEGEEAAEESGAERSETVGGYEAVLEKIREDFPDLITAALDPDELVRRLVLAARTDGEEEDIEKWVHVRLLAAEVLDSVGEPGDARALWQQVALRDAASPAARARALFEMGLHYLLRERYRDTWKSWKYLDSLAPEAPFTRAAKRYEPFLEMLDSGGEVPDFRADFGKGVGTRSLRQLRGRWVLLYFWMSTVPNAYSDAQNFRVALDKIRNHGWNGVVLGVNLDRDRKEYRTAVKDWLIDYYPADGGAPYPVPVFDWPQFRDRRGFKSPIVRALALPRVPMQLLIDPEGRLRFATEVKAVTATSGDSGKRKGPKYRRTTPTDLERLIRRLTGG